MGYSEIQNLGLSNSKSRPTNEHAKTNQVSGYVIRFLALLWLIGPPFIFSMINQANKGSPVSTRYADWYPRQYKLHKSDRNRLTCQSVTAKTRTYVLFGFLGCIFFSISTILNLTHFTVSLTNIFKYPEGFMVMLFPVLFKSC